MTFPTMKTLVVEAAKAASTKEIFVSPELEINKGPGSVDLRLLRGHRLAPAPLADVLPPGVVETRLGAGSFGTVYRFKPDDGPMMALKISEDEPEAYEEIQKIYDTAPRELIRHLPKIYGIWSVDTETVITLMEILSPLPKNIKTAMVRGDPENRMSWEEFVQSDKRVGRLMRITLGLLDTETRPELVERLPHAVAGLRRTYNLNAPHDFEDDAQAARLRDAIIDSAKEVGIRPGPRMHNSLDVFDYNRAMLTITPTSRAHWKNLGDEGDDKLESLGILPFYEALREIHERYGISWQDLHDDNVMVRKSDGHLVVADIGNFYKYD